MCSQLPVSVQKDNDVRKTELAGTVWLPHRGMATLTGLFESGSPVEFSIREAHPDQTTRHKGNLRLDGDGTFGVLCGKTYGAGESSPKDIWTKWTGKWAVAGDKLTLEVLECDNGKEPGMIWPEKRDTGTGVPGPYATYIFRYSITGGTLTFYPAGQVAP